jgi:glycine hydroxymethyltransferase
VASARPSSARSATLILEVLDGLKAANSEEGNAQVEAAVKEKVVALTDRFPLYPHLG